ncbi:MAG: hypothetical protein OEZ68_18700 [Gammaproteobacteria bacterium]|nr:hypothetical protein [Gammaproteobacteria bacterium]MDH5802837.1 hypothetical protein [Gammaproteobacteria bacterium]
MSNCCNIDPTPRHSKKHRCPVNNKKYAPVDRQTMLHHLKSAWYRLLKVQQYYFCDSPDCDVVYFGEDDKVITVAELRHPIGQKQTGNDKKICYCFGITLSDIKNNPLLKQFVIKQTKERNCSCETKNPSGRCCLKDFP